MKVVLSMMSVLLLTSSFARSEDVPPTVSEKKDPAEPPPQGSAFSPISKELPVHIDADQGILCERDKKICTASGNVVATHGEFVLTGDTLVAHFREGKNQTNELYKLEAFGDILHGYNTGKHQEVWGQHAVYTLDDDLVRVQGNNLRLEVGEGKQMLVVKARDTLEYSNVTSEAKAKGNAFATREQNQVEADLLHAFFKKNQEDKFEIDHVEGHGHVRVTTPAELAQGDHGIYYDKDQFVTLEGNVQIVRCDGQINGNYGEVKLDTGISKVLSVSPREERKSDQKRERVHVLILPKEKKRT